MISYKICVAVLFQTTVAILQINNDNRYYKISMVSSEQDPGRPALFIHGASPVWDSDRQGLLFVDVLQQNVYRLDYFSGKIYTKNIGYGPVNVVSLVSGSKRVLVAVRSALYLLDWMLPGDSALRLLTTVDQGQPDNVISTGSSDRNGRFWAGTRGPQMAMSVIPDRGTLYFVEQDGLAHPNAQLRPVSISSGLVWSPNNTVLYYVDSLTRKVEAFDYDAVSGNIGGRRTIIDVTKVGFEEAIPNGITIDTQGFLWVTVMFGGAILHVDPDTRQVAYAYKLPVSRVTSLAWGGPKLDELFITTARAPDELSEPLAGAIFTLRDTGYQGVRPNAFHFDNADLY